MHAKAIVSCPNDDDDYIVSSERADQYMIRYKQEEVGLACYHMYISTTRYPKRPWRFPNPQSWYPLRDSTISPRRFSNPRSGYPLRDSATSPLTCARQQTTNKHSQHSHHTLTVYRCCLCAVRFFAELCWKSDNYHSVRKLLVAFFFLRKSSIDKSMTVTYEKIFNLPFYSRARWLFLQILLTQTQRKLEPLRTKPTENWKGNFIVVIRAVLSSLERERERERARERETKRFETRGFSSSCLLTTVDNYLYLQKECLGAETSLSKVSPTP